MWTAAPRRRPRVRCGHGARHGPSEPGGPCGRGSAWIRVSHPRPIPGTPGTIARPTHRSRVDALPVVRATRFVETLDGRKLAYVEFGDPSSPLVIHNHGGPSSRLEGRLLANGATSNGLRLVSVDRPGIGRSTPQKHRSFESWANDRRRAGVPGVWRERMVGGRPVAARG